MEINLATLVKRNLKKNSYYCWMINALPYNITYIEVITQQKIVLKVFDYHKMITRL